MWRKIIWGLGIVIFILTILYFDLISYGLRQGWGQARLLWQVQSFERFLAKSDYPDSTKQFFRKKIAMIREIKTFAVEALGLKDNGNYEKIYDQKNDPVLWAVTASKPFALEPYTWHYGPFGSMPYRGYFDSTRAYQLRDRLAEEGFDADLYNPSAWSTLGWFKDPVLSNMLYWSEGHLAALIIHEMTHGTIWLTGEVDYNENLADFVGDYGAKRYLIKKYGKTSKEYLDFVNSLSDSEKFSQHLLRGAQSLDKFYSQLPEKLPLSEKKKRKAQKIKQIVSAIDTLSFARPEHYRRVFAGELPNNTLFMSYRRYRGKQGDFEKICREKFGNDLRRYVAYLKERFPA